MGNQVRIEDVIQADGFELNGGNRYLKGVEHESLVVDLEAQRYAWNATLEQGNVLDWVMNRQKIDFVGACEWLKNFALTKKKYNSVRLVSLAKMAAQAKGTNNFEPLLWAVVVIFGQLEPQSQIYEMAEVHAALGMSTRDFNRLVKDFGARRETWLRANSYFQIPGIETYPNGSTACI